MRAYLITPDHGPRSWVTVRAQAQSDIKDRGGAWVEQEVPVRLADLVPLLNQIERDAYARGMAANAPTSVAGHASPPPAPVDAPAPQPAPTPAPAANDEGFTEDEKAFDARILESQVEALGTLGVAGLERFDGWSEICGISAGFARGVALLNVIAADEHSLARVFLRDRLKKRRRFG